MPDEEENRSSAARRARGRCRRYFAANCLNRLGTLTYRPPGQHDAVALRGDVALFFRKLRGYIGGPFPYLWTPEWHKSEHGLHVHFGVGRYIYRSWLLASWPHGFVHIKLLGDLPARAGVLGESRAAARYLAKYVGKDYRDTVPGMHSYDVAQGFAPEQVIYRGRTEGEVLARCAEAMGRMPSYIWRSIELGDKWHGPLAVFAQWA